MWLNPNPNPIIPTPTVAPTQPPTQPMMGQPAVQQIPPFWGDQFKGILDGYNQLQWDLNLQNLLFLIKIELERSEEVISKVKSGDVSKKIWDTQSSRAQVEHVRDRCSKIKKRNQNILIRMMNLR